jgi:hypothetical protein
LATDWNVARHGERCTGCGHTFEVNETFAAVLYPGGESGFERRDYCANCEPAADPPAIGQWKARRCPPAEPKSTPFDREAMFEFFLRLDATTSEKLQFRFALALLLWRKKLLKFTEAGVDDEDREVWHFKAPRDGSSHTVLKPELDEDQIETLSAQLEALLISGAAPAGAIAAGSGGGDIDA